MKSIRLLSLIGAFFAATLLIAPVHADDAGARAELIGSWQKMTTQKDLGFRVRTTTTSKGKSLSSSMEVRWPDRFHMKTEQSEMVILPSGTWLNANGNWMKLPMDMKKVIAQFTPEVMEKSMKGTKNVEFIGLDQVNGKPVKVYTFDFDMELMGIHSSGSSKLFLSTVDGYPLRMESHGKARGQESDTVVEYEYDDSIRIQAPN